MNNTKKCIGLIAEDDSDIATLKELIRRITGKANLSFKHFVGRGCGKVKRKADAWAKQLAARGCHVLILVHDLDKNNFEKLYNSIEENLKPFVITDTLINIPIEEMESWFLSDSNAVKLALNLPKEIKKYHKPESVVSPKEVLGREIEKASVNSKIYINTKHNPLIAKVVNINTLKEKCISFKELHEFAIEKIK